MTSFSALARQLGQRPGRVDLGGHAATRDRRRIDRSALRKAEEDLAHALNHLSGYNPFPRAPTRDYLIAAADEARERLGGPWWRRGAWLHDLEPSSRRRR